MSGIKIPAKCGLGVLFTLIALVLSVYQTAWAAERLAVIKFNEVSQADLQPVTDVLDDEGWSYQVLGPSDSGLTAGAFPKALLLLPAKADPDAVAAIEKYIAGGGKIILIPPADGAPDESVKPIFDAVGLSVGGTSFPAQDVAIRWLTQPAERVKNLPPETRATDTLGVGAQVLTLSGESGSVLAKWGDEFAAVVVTAHGGLLNWPFGRELTSEVNAVALASALNQAWPVAAENTQSVTALSGAAFYSSPALQSRLDKLRVYETRLDDAVEMALKLNVPVPVKELQQLRLQAGLSEAEFIHSFKLGNDDAAKQAYDEAERLLGRATLLTTYSPRVEGRAIWLDRGAIVRSGSPVGLKKLIRELHDAGINVIYFETLNAGFPIYPSKITMQNPMIEGWDPLKVAVEEGHRLGMEVHAWVWTFAVGNTRHNPIIGEPRDYPGPVLQEDGYMSEALRNSGGGLGATGRQTEYWLSPASPKARAYLLSVFSEIVKNYDVDGLQLDYIRYPFQSSGDQMGFEPVGRERFQQSTGIMLSPGMSDQARRVWMAWKTYQVSSFVKEVSGTLKAIKPNLKLSAAVFPMPRATRIVAIQQDWETWLDNGWLDTLSPMSYTSSPRKLKNTFLSVENSTKKKALVYPGIAIDRLDAQDLLTQIKTIREEGGLGNTLFAMSHLDTPKAQALKVGPYREHDTITPHANPLGAVDLLLHDFSGAFDLMVSKNVPTNMTAEQQKAIETDLADLNQEIHPLVAAAAADKTDPPGVEDLKALEQKVDTLDAPLHAWFAEDQKTHPYRVLYFGEIMSRAEFLLDYLNDHVAAAAQPFNPPDVPVDALTQPAASPATAPAKTAPATTTPAQPVTLPKTAPKPETPKPKEKPAVKAPVKKTAAHAVKTEKRTATKTRVKKLIHTTPAKKHAVLPSKKSTVHHRR